MYRTRHILELYQNEVDAQDWSSDRASVLPWICRMDRGIKKTEGPEIKQHPVPGEDSPSLQTGCVTVAESDDHHQQGEISHGVDEDNDHCRADKAV